MPVLYRKYLEDRTEGRLMLPDDSEIRTLELPWKDNKKNESCIPEGVYVVQRDYTGRFQWFKITYVEDRTHIELHEGSKPEHSAGCILMNRESLEKLVEWYGDSRWVLEILEDTNG